MGTDARQRGILERTIDTRHTFATWLVKNGVNLVTVKELMSRSSLRTLERYARPGAHSRGDAICRLDRPGDVKTVIDLEEKKG